MFRTVLAVLVLSLVLAGCGKKANPKPYDPPVAPQASSPPAEGN